MRPIKTISYQTKEAQQILKISKEKFDLALARNCKTLRELEGVLSPVTLYRMRNDRSYTPQTKTVGKLAAALGVDPSDIVKEES